MKCKLNINTVFDQRVDVMSDMTNNHYAWCACGYWRNRAVNDGFDALVDDWEEHKSGWGRVDV